MSQKLPAVCMSSARGPVSTSEFAVLPFFRTGSKKRGYFAVLLVSSRVYCTFPVQNGHSLGFSRGRGAALTFRLRNRDDFLSTESRDPSTERTFLVGIRLKGTIWF
jgi:hypothetical protein